VGDKTRDEECVMGKYTKRIERGAGLLDKTRPGWRNQVDLASLDLGSCARCVLGQLLGSYHGRHELGLDDEGYAAWHGFTLGSFEAVSDGGDPYIQLTEEWRQYIRETRQQVVS
jgi:hypothetical protein